MAEVGQLYIDKMFRSEMEVVSVDDIAVFLRDTELDKETSGSPYLHDEFQACVESGRFRRVDHLLEAEEQIKEEVEHFEEAMELDREGVYQDEEEEEDDNETEEAGDTFESQDALSW